MFSQPPISLDLTMQVLDPPSLSMFLSCWEGGSTTDLMCAVWGTGENESGQISPREQTQVAVSL